MEERIKTAFYQHVETILKTMAEKGMMHKVFDRNIERWTQSTLFMDAFNAAH